MNHRRTGLAVGLLWFAIAIIVGAIMLTVWETPLDIVFTQAKANTETQAAATGIGYLEDAWGAAPFIILGLATVLILARAASQREFGGAP